MKAILHIGTGKTGTTSLQEFVRQNAESLLRQGFIFPGHTNEGDQWVLALAALDNGRPHSITNRRPRLRDTRHRAEFVQTWLSKLFAEVDLRREQCSTAIFISEFLCDLRESEIRRLHAMLAPRFDSVSIVLYLRDPVDYAVSMFDTALKVGQTRLAPEAGKVGGQTDYAAMLRRWVEVYGKDSISVRLFEKTELRNGDIIDDFAELVGFIPTGMDRPQSMNVSLDMNGQAVLRLINSLLEQCETGSFPAGRRKRLRELFERHFSSGPRRTATPDLVRACEKNLSDSNEWVRRTFFPTRERLFTPRKLAAASPTPDPMFVESTAGAIAELMSLSRRSGSFP